MNRRRMLTAVGASCVLPTLWYATRPPRRSIDVRFWFSRRASQYEGAAPRVRSYLESALEPAYEDVVISHGGVVSVATEHGYWVTSSGEWPQRIAEGALVDDGLDPVSDVNLLVTDGDMRRAPTGAGIPNIASVGGASHLEAVSPRDEVDDVVPNTTPTRVMQILLHEVGHALGLKHEHGSIVTTDTAITASPMVSAYAWSNDPVSSEQFDAEQCACGSAYPTDRDGDRYVSFAFSECAKTTLREYNGGLFP